MDPRRQWTFVSCPACAGDISHPRAFLPRELAGSDPYYDGQPECQAVQVSITLFLIYCCPPPPPFPSQHGPLIISGFACRIGAAKTPASILTLPPDILGIIVRQLAWRDVLHLSSVHSALRGAASLYQVL